MPSDERKARVLEVFRRALGVPPVQRPAFLEQECAADAAMQTIVESMLIQYRERKLALETMDKPPLPEEQEDEADRLIGARIEAFRIRRHISSGGMGRVYEAVQDKPRRVVALKVMIRGIASRSALRRLEFEAQLLGRLRHPGIAQVYHAGTFNDGYGEAPYFAMEYVPNARTLTEYAKWADLSTGRRLELFVRVCQAVHHGHQKGIIHRDLKPGNILVDSSGQPKVIDFGVARSTDSDMAVTTLQTDVGQLIGTLQYMSPEQCDADPHDIDTRSDIYSLGVVLFELLCDQLPYDIAQAPLHDAARIVRETTPVKPSSINRMLRGDIETITLKALEKDRSLRYQSALDLAQDIERYLRRESIRARSPGAVQQILRTARRHRKMTATAATIGLLMLTATCVSIPFAIRAARQQREMERESETKMEEAEARLGEMRERMRLAIAKHEAALQKVYVGEIVAADAAKRHDETRAFETHLAATPIDHRGWEYRYLRGRRISPAPTIPYGDRITTVCVNDDGKLAAVRLGDGSLHMRDLVRRRELIAPEPETSAIALSHDGLLLATADNDQSIRIWTLSDGTLHDEFVNNFVNYDSVTFSGDDSHLAAATRDNVRVWNFENDPLERRINTLDATKPHAIVSIALNHDGSRLAIGYEERMIELCHTDPRSHVVLRDQEQFKAKVTTVAFGPEGTRVAVGTVDGSVGIWDTIDGRVRSLPHLHSGPVRAVSFGDGGKRLASASDDHTVRVWDVQTGVCVITLRGHQERVSSVAFSHDGQVLLSGSEDGVMYVWDTR